MTRPTGPVDAFDQLLVDLDARAKNAANRNKPTMWAYYADVAQGLRDWFAEIHRDDLNYAIAARNLSDHAETACPNLLEPVTAARLWARGVYARQILRVWSAAPRASLDWLRARVVDG